MDWREISTTTLLAVSFSMIWGSIIILAIALIARA